VDRYGETLVAQFLRQRRRALEDVTGRRPAGRNRPARACTSAPTPAAARWRVCPKRPAGCEAEPGGTPTPPVDVLREHGWQLALDIADRPQDRFLPRPARQPACSLPSSSRGSVFERVLNCFCYTGGFTVAALRWRRWPR